MRLESAVFPDGGEIPPEHSRDGGDISPPLLWSGVPAGAASLTLVCDDPDAPRGTWVHWVVYDLRPSLPGLPAGVPKTASLPEGGVQGKSDYGEIGWGGPAPPRGHGTHHSSFRLYALDTKLDLPPGATKARLEAAMKGHALAEAKRMGTYRRDRGVPQAGDDARNAALERILFIDSGAQGQTPAGSGSSRAMETQRPYASRQGRPLAF